MTSPRLRRPSAVLAAAALAIAALFAFAAPASAHDQLLSSDPADGASVDALPTQITLTFSAELLGDASGGNQVQVTDASGATLNDGEAQVDGTNLVQPLTGEATGAVSVQWRAVSSDGHPIAGEFAFDVAAGPAPAPVESTAPAETPEPTMTTLVEPAPSPTETAPATAEAASPLPWIVGAVILLAVIALVIVLLVRPKGPRGPGAGSATGSDR